MSDGIVLENSTYSVDGNQSVPFSFPLNIEPAEDIVTVETDVVLGFPYPQTLRLIPDDCLEKLVVNGEEVQDENIPFCPPYQVGQPYDLREYLHIGTNHLEITVRDIVGLVQLEIQSEPQNSQLLRILRFVVALYIFFYVLLRLK